VLGPDHLITLLAATALTESLVQLGEAQSARVLGEDTLQRSRRVFGPDSPITHHFAQAASVGHTVLGGDAAADRTNGPL